jgi:hypothetical protein
MATARRDGQRGDRIAVAPSSGRAARRTRSHRQDHRPALGTSAPGNGGWKTPQDSTKDLAYVALSSVTKAAHSYARTLDADSTRTTIAILFPIIVIRGKLFETWYYGEDLVVQPITHGQILWKHVPGQAPDLVDVITEDAFDSFADRLQESSLDIISQGKDAAQRMNISHIWI